MSETVVPERWRRDYDRMHESNWPVFHNDVDVKLIIALIEELGAAEARNRELEAQVGELEQERERATNELTSVTQERNSLSERSISQDQELVAAKGYNDFLLKEIAKTRDLFLGKSHAIGGDALIEIRHDIKFHGRRNIHKLSEQLPALTQERAELSGQVRRLKDALNLMRRIASGEDQYFRGKEIENDTNALGIIWAECNIALDDAALALPEVKEPK